MFFALVGVGTEIYVQKIKPKLYKEAVCFNIQIVLYTVFIRKRPTESLPLVY